VHTEAHTFTEIANRNTCSSASGARDRPARSAGERPNGSTPRHSNSTTCSSCASTGAPEAEALRGFGLTEGTSNVHPGQGTTNQRFIFRNSMLELLWVHEAAEAQAGPTALPTIQCAT
jgi:hypothetical protein